MKGRVKVQLVPMGSKIRYRIAGKVWCSRQETFLPNSRVYSKNDLVWKHIFSPKQLRVFLKKNRPRWVVVSLYDLGYDSCDSIK